MTSVDIELALVGLVAMLEPATLVTSFLALVVGSRPLRTGFWFFVGGLGATLAVGVLAALVLGDAAASPTSTPKTWVSIFNILAGVAILAYVAWAVRRKSDAQKTAATVARIRELDQASPLTVVAAGAVLANAGIFMVVALKDISQLDPSTLQYILDWTLFASVSLLPLGVALLLLRFAPGPTVPRLSRAGV
jgi:Sap-like sulfolipid-1-addressing protein